MKTVPAVTFVCAFLIVLSFLPSSLSEAHKLKHKHSPSESEEEAQSQNDNAKRVENPSLIIGNPEAFGSSLSDGESYVSKFPKIPVNLARYERETSDLKSDEAYVRSLILRRFKRDKSNDRKKAQDEEDEEQAERERIRAEEDEQEEILNKDIESKKSSTSTTAASASSTTSTAPTPAKPQPQPGTSTTAKPSGSGNNPSNPPTTKPPSGAPAKPLPPPQMGMKPPGNGTAPKRPPGPGGRPPFPPGGKRPPFPAFLLNRNATRKPAKKGELYLPEDYNNLEIPKLDAGKLFGIKLDKLSPVPVLVFLNIRNIRDIDEESEEIVLDMDMKVEWVDGVLFDPFNALQKKPMKPTTLNPIFLRKIWQPDIYIDEIVRVHRTYLMATPHTLLFSSGTGLVSYTFRIQVRLACDMDYYYYPADTHRCEFKLRSYSYFDYDLDLSWLRQGVYLQDPSDPNFDLRIDDVHELKLDQTFKESNNDTYDGLSFTVVARRKLSYHMVQTYLPSIFFIIITWLCFLVPARMVEARIGISMTTLLTLTAMFSSVRESTPIVSYVKAIDLWMVFCIFFVFLTLLEFSLLVWIRSFREDAEEKKLEHEREMQARRGHKDRSPSPSRLSKTSIKSEDLKVYETFAEFTEKWAFLIFSIVFMVFNIVYWSWLLTASDYFDWSVNATHNGMLDLEDD